MSALLGGRETTRSVAGVAVPRRPRSWTSAMLAIHVASLAIAFAVLLRLGRNLWFFGDEWDFLASRWNGIRMGLWLPHNEHWSTIPILVYHALFDAVGLRSYLPYLGVLLAIHVGIAHLVWRMMIRSGVEPWLATALAVVLLLLGGGWEDLFQAFQMTFLGSVLLGLLALLLVDHDGPFGRRDVAGWVASVAALMCSGVGVTMVIVAGVAVLLRRGWWVAALTVSVPAVAYVVWFLRDGHQNAATIPASTVQLLSVPTYVWTGLGNAVERGTGWPGAGAPLLLALLSLLLGQRRIARGRAAAVFAVAVGAVVFLTISGVGRIALGIGQATAPRYVYIVCALLLAAVGLVLTGIARGRPAVGWVVLVAVAAATLQGSGVLVSSARSVVGLEQPYREQILASARLVETGAPLVVGPRALPEPRYDPNLTLRGLRELVAGGAFGAVAEQPPAARLAASLQLQVDAGDVPAISGGPAPVLSSAPAATPAGPGCVELGGGAGPTLRLLYSGPASVRLTPGSDGTLTVQLATASDPSTLSAPRTFPLLAGRTVVLDVSAAQADPLVSLPPGRSVLCGVQR